MRRVLAVGLLAVGVTALAPSASADPVLGSYSASAEAAIVRIGIYDPAFPIPAEPQIDVGIGFGRATTANGPSSRAVASYLWPGDAVGDGLGVLLANEALAYPIKTSSSFPATETSPAQDALQVNDGNGMATSADGRTTRATVVGLGLGNGLGDPGGGLCKLAEQCTEQPSSVDLPDPIAAAATIENLKSQSTVVLEAERITATARSVASGLTVLGGLITIDHVDMRSESTSDGATGSARGTSNITGLRVLGQAVDLGDPVDLAGTSAPAPRFPQALEELGITIEYLGRHSSEDRATGSLRAEGLTITLDVAPLRDLLQLGGLSDLLSPAFVDVDQVGPLLLGLAKLGSKIVITVGDVRTAATAAPAYVLPDGQALPPEGAATGGGVPLPPVDGVVPGQVPDLMVPRVTEPAVTVAPVSIDLPGLGRVPRWFVLAGLVLVALAGQGIRGFGTWAFAGGSCPDGHSIGVPDLRKAVSP